MPGWRAEGQKPKGRRDGSALWSAVDEDEFGSQWRKEEKGQAGLPLQLHYIVDIPCKSELSCHITVAVMMVVLVRVMVSHRTVCNG